MNQIQFSGENSITNTIENAKGHMITMPEIFECMPFCTPPDCIDTIGIINKVWAENHFYVNNVIRNGMGYLDKRLVHSPQSSPEILGFPVFCDTIIRAVVKIKPADRICY